MVLSVELVVFLFTILAVLIGIIYRNLDNKIGGVGDSVKALAERATDKETCSLRVQLHEEKFLNIHGKMAEVRDQNREYHEHLSGLLQTLHETVDSIRECVTKLSAGIDCD